MAAELAMSIAAPTPWKTRRTISQMAPAWPDIQPTLSSKEKNVKMAKPRLYMRTRPKMSPIRPSVVTKTLVTTRNPRIIHSR